MQQAPVMKGSGLKPLSEGKSGDQPVHVFGSNLESRVVTEDNPDEASTLHFGDDFDRGISTGEDMETIRKRKFDAITGEEDEKSVFQGDFKLFAWDLSSSNWIEKGRGQLKLNDSLDEDIKKSRIIMRLGGTLKIVLNVAIKHSTFKVIANSRTSIRFTDSQTVWAASGSNASQLRDLIDERLQLAAEQEAEAIKKKPKTDQESGEQSTTEKSNDVVDATTDSKNESENNSENNSDKSSTEDGQHRSLTEDSNHNKNERLSTPEEVSNDQSDKLNQGKSENSASPDNDESSEDKVKEEEGPVSGGEPNSATSDDHDKSSTAKDDTRESKEENSESSHVSKEHS